MATGIKQSSAHTKRMVEKVSLIERKSVDIAEEIAKLNTDVRRIGMYFIMHYTQWVRERYLWYVSCTNLIQASWHNASVLLYSKPHLGEPDQSAQPPLTPRGKPVL